MVLDLVPKIRSPSEIRSIQPPLPKIQPDQDGVLR